MRILSSMTHHPIVIIDGPDGLGKTTWSREFAQMHNGRYLHLTLRKNMFAYQAMSLSTAIRWSKKCPVVIDRHWPSEIIYSEVYRDGTKLLKEACALEQIMSGIGVYYVFALLETPAQMLDQYREVKTIRAEMYDCDEKYMKLAECFLKFAQSFIGFHPHNSSIFNFRTDNLKDHVDTTHSLAVFWKLLHNPTRDGFNVESGKDIFLKRLTELSGVDLPII